MTSDRPLILPLAALSAGCLLEYLLAVPVSPLLPLLAVTVVIVVLPFRKSLLFNVLLVLFWMSWGMADLSFRFNSLSSGSSIVAYDGQTVIVEGTLLQRPVILSEGCRFVLKTERIFKADDVLRVNGALLVTIAESHRDWMSGDRLRIPAKVRVPRLLGLPGEFDYPRYLTLRGIDATARVKDADAVVLMRREAVLSPCRWIDDYALRSHAFISKVVPDPGSRGVLLALATGSQYEIPADLVDAYRRAGISHILSVSGFHVGVVTLIWVLILRWLLLRCEWLALRLDVRRSVMLAAVPVMIFYLLFTGGAPATARAVLMMSAMAFALWSEREFDMLDALLLAAFLLLLFDTALLFDLSFQLSFLSLWGLVVLTPLILIPFRRFRQSGWCYTALQFVAASLAAILATLIPVLVYFHQVSFTGIAANLFIVPLLGYGATVLSTTAIPLIFVFPAAATVLLKLAALLVQISNYGVDWISRLPVLHSYSVKPSVLIAMVTVLLLFSFVKSLRGRVLISSAACAVLVFQSVITAQQVDGKMRLNFLSVGQGDALLTFLPDGRTMLVDGGGYLYDSTTDFGERYLVPALHALNVRRIDIMVLTHPHPDHLGGLPAVAERFPVTELWQTDQQGQGSDYQRLIAALDCQGTALRTLKQGDQPLSSGNVMVTVVSPTGTARNKEADNEDSLVLRVQYGSFSALLMADAGFAVEDQLIRQKIEEATLLKVGHHGSRSASGEPFLHRIRPKLAVISAGAGNSFGLPAAETVERLRQCGAQIYRTDLQGTLQVTTDGSSVTVQRHISENRLLSAARRFVLTGNELLR